MHAQDEVAAALMAQLGGNYSGRRPGSEQEVEDTGTYGNMLDNPMFQDRPSGVGPEGCSQFSSLQQALRYVTAPPRGGSRVADGLRRQQVRVVAHWNP